MPSKMRHGLLITIAIIGLFFTSVLTSYAETVNYIYDELNRLIRVEYGDGTKIMYTYDEAGNRQYVGLYDTLPPVTTATPPGGTYETAQSVTLTCNDDISGCNNIYYTTNGNDPTESSPTYSAPINISVTTTLKFFAKDLAGNSETIKTETYYFGTETISTPSNPNGPITGYIQTSYTYSTGGAASSYGHSIQYLFDWGDGTDSGWLPVGQTSASHSWSSQGNYLVKAQARCSIHTSVVSDWSGTTSVSIVLPPGNDSYTKSLLHMNGTDGSTTFTDSASGGTHIWTAYGTAQIDTAQSKFGGASGLFDGDSDYLTTPDSPDFYFGTGDFTVDFWVRFNAFPGANSKTAFFEQYQSAGNYIEFSLYVWTDGSTKYLSLSVYSGGSQTILVLKQTTMNLNTWYHIAYVRSGNTFTIYQDGVQVGTSTTDDSEMPDFTGLWYLGKWPASSQHWLNGWLDEFRVSKGIARWTSNFTPPTEAYQSGPESVSTPSNPNGPINGNVGTSYTYSTGGAASSYGHSIEYLFDWGDGTNSGWLPVGQTSASHSWNSQGNYLVKAQARCSIHTSVVSSWSETTSVSIVLPTGNDSYTKSLLHMDGTDGSTTFTDSASGGTHTWTAYGNAQIDTAQSKFGGASGLLDGTGDYIDTPDSGDHEPAAGDFTVDFWVRFNALTGMHTLFARRTSEAGATKDFFGGYYQAGTIQTLTFTARSNAVTKADYVASWVPSTNTWYHIAFVRNGSNFYIFINGVSQTLTVNTAIDSNDLTFTYASGEKLTVGRHGDGDMGYVNGWIDEFRFSKGIARWTSNFTPPTVAYAGEYTLSVNVVGNGTVTKNPDLPIYTEGTSVTLTAVNGSQTFSEWSGDLTGNTNPTAIVMNGNKSVTATFVTPTGWLQGWTYRKAVTLSHASGAVTNYQMKLLVGESSGASGENVDCNGHVLSSFNDLRFTTSDGTTLLDYWIESITGTTPNQLATVWIKFNSIGTSATTFYMYYGKADATAVSNDSGSLSPGADFNDGTTTGLTINTAGSASITVPTITQLFGSIKVDDWIKYYAGNPVLDVLPAGLNDSYTKSLLLFDGADTSTTFTDSAAGGPHTWNGYGNVQLDTAQKKFGTASLLLDGTGDYIDTPDSTDHEPAAGDFTVDLWVRFNALPSAGASATFWSRRTGVAVQDVLQSSFVNSTPSKLTFVSYVNTVKVADYYVEWTPTLNTWYHLAIVRDGSTIRAFIDGVSQSVTEVTAIGTSDLTFSGSGEKLTIGRNGNSDSNYINGWIDCFRFSKGVARWISSFTPAWQGYAVRDLAPVIDENGYAVIESGKMIFLYRGYNGTSNQGGRATSIDGGITFGERLDVPVLPLGPGGSWYETVCSPSSVIKEASTGTYYAFVQGKDAGSIARIGYFTSTDQGITWSNGGYILECGSFTGPETITNIGVPWIIKGESGYILLFEGVGATPGKFRIYGATASSLSGPWTPMNSGNPILAVGSAGQWDDFGVANPKLVRVAANQYLLAYNGNKSGENKWRVGFAIATTDLISWTKHTNNPVLAFEGSGWESYHLEASAMVRDNYGSQQKNITLWYQGFSSTGDDPKIGIAKCHQGRILHGADTAAVADGYIIGSMQPNGFMASLLSRESSDPSDVGNVRLLMLYDGASVPNPGVNTDMNPYLRFGAARRSPTHASPNQFFIFYVNAADTTYYWDGSAWQTSVTHFGGAGQYEVRVWDDGTNFKADILNWWTGVSILNNVASIAKASVKAFNSGRALLCGDQYTSHYYLGHKLDNLIVGQYLLPEPTWGSWGTEQTN